MNENNELLDALNCLYEQAHEITDYYQFPPKYAAAILAHIEDLQAEITMLKNANAAWRREFRISD